VANTIPKLIVDRSAVLSVRTKLRKLRKGEGLQLTGNERKALLALIREGERTVFPTQMALDRYQSDMDDIAQVDQNTRPEKWHFFANRIEEFENEYCK
jgi:hypothetical protein